MGLSSSQARLLNLTARMHDIEYKAQNLEAQKLQMANESRQVYQEYENALNKQKVQFKQINTDGSATYQDASISTLLNAGYKIKFIKDGAEKTFNKDNVTDGHLSTGEIIDTTESTQSNVPNEDLIGYNVGDRWTCPNPSYRNTYIITSLTPAGSKYTTVTGYIVHPGTIDSDYGNIDLNSPETLRNLVEAGYIVFEKPTNETDENGQRIFIETNIATDTNLQEVTDDTELKKAEAKYEADMRKIDAKDKKFDTDLAAIDNERNAIKTEMETLKTVAKENVDRTFKLFS